MAGIEFQAVATITLAPGDSYTLLQLVAATNQRFRVKRISVSAKGAAQADKPSKMEVVSQTTAGTMASNTLKKVDPLTGETLQTTAQQKHASPVEPTTDAQPYYVAYVYPFGGEKTWIPVDPKGLLVYGGKRLGVKLTHDASASGNCEYSVVVDCEE